VTGDRQVTHVHHETPAGPEPDAPAAYIPEEEPVRALVVPALGVAVDLAKPVEAARALGDVDELMGQLGEVKRVLQAVVLQEGERLGTRRVQFADGTMAELGADTDLAWDDVEGMRVELQEAGLPEDRQGALFRQTVETKVVATVANELARNNETYREIIERHRRRIPKRPSVKVHVPAKGTPLG